MKDRSARTVVHLALRAVSVGCASTIDIEPDLNAAVGVYVGDFNGALWARRTLLSDDGTTRTVQYGLNEQCQFVLEMDSQTFVVKSWRYVDAASARHCRRLPLHRAL